VSVTGIGWVMYDIGDLMSCRSPSPEPVYNHEGKRTNTREVRTRKKLEGERHRLVQKMLLLNPQFRPPHDYRWAVDIESVLWSAPRWVY